MKLIKTGPTGSDETAPYSVTNYQAKTVVEFVHEVLEQNPNEWGYIKMKDEPAGNDFNWNTRIEYRYGKLLNEIPDAWQSREIDKVDAAGGWSRMDYFITAKRPYNYETTTTEKNNMAIQDIMIGDWVMVYPWDETPWKPKKITDINFHSWEGADFCDSVGVEGWDELSLNQIKPIPLTAEILEKNGFAKVVENEHWCTYQFLIPTSYKETPYSIQFTFCNEPTSSVNTIFNCWGPTSSEGRGVNDINMCNLEYVHELQHILKLCKISKEIKL